MTDTLSPLARIALGGAEGNKSHINQFTYPKGWNEQDEYPKPDFNRYKQYQTWRCIEAIYLLAELDIHFHGVTITDGYWDIWEHVLRDEGIRSGGSFPFLRWFNKAIDILEAFDRRPDGLKLKDKIKPREFVTWAYERGFPIPDELKDLIDRPKPEAGKKQSAKERDAQCTALANRIHDDYPDLSKGNIARIIKDTDIGKMYSGEDAIKKALKGKIPGLNSGNPSKEVSDQQKKRESEIIASKRYSE